MPATTSVIWDVRKALIAQLKTLPELEKVTVETTFQPGLDRAEQVVTNRARFIAEPAGMRPGRHHRNETGTFEVAVIVQHPLGVQQAVARALAIGAAIESWIADHKNGEGLGVEGVNTLVIDDDGAEMTEQFADPGGVAAVVYPIRYTARLT